MKHFAVVGNPIAHSKSPLIFGSAYLPEDFQGTFIRIHTLSAQNIPQLYDDLKLDGISITAPFKSGVITDTRNFLTRVDAMTKKIGVANTVVRTKKGNVAYNTDYLAVRVLLKKNIDTTIPQTAVVVGAGGAAVAVIYALRSLDIPIILLNRTYDKALRVAKEVGGDIEVYPLSNLSEFIEKRATIVVNTLPCPIDLSIFKCLQKIVLYIESSYMYKEVQLGKTKKISGEDWLIYQGKEAYELFTGIVPSIVLMQTAIQSYLYYQKPIAIIGFMGSGKSTVLRELASRATGFATVDSDNDIEKITHQTISNFFAEFGELAFREIEYELLNKYIGSKTIISCGGGVVSHAPSLELLKKHYTTVWIYTSSKDCWDRVKHQSHRPLVRSEAEFLDLCDKRLSAYHQATDLLIDAQHFTPLEIADIISRAYFPN